jgi:CopG family nickel-responsive transcriptional regulator
VSGTVRFTISLPEELLQTLDEQIIDEGYAGRSEFIRDLIREKIVERAWKEGETVVGVLTLVYDHHQRNISRRMLEIQHGAGDDVILCTTHVHIDHHNCVETIILKGRAEHLTRLADEIGGLKGILFAKLTRTMAFPASHSHSH